MNRSLLLPLLLLLPLPFPLAAGESLATAPAELQELPREVRLDGMVEAVNQTTVSAQTGGQVAEVLFDVNDFVEKGAVIVRLKDTEPRARLNQAEAELRVAAARLKEAQEEFQRIKGVFDKQAVSQSAMDKATAELRQVAAQREAAEAQLAQAREQFEYTQVRAPYSGIVTQRQVEVGSVAAPGQPLMSGISLDQLRVVVEVPQSLIPAVRSRQQARVELPSGDAVPARKITIFPFVQHGSNTFRVRLDLPEGLPNLVPGMFVKTAFTVGRRQSLTIPEEAVVHRSEVTGVYVASGSRVALRQVRLGERDGTGRVAVLAGLEAGEQVALEPVAAVARLQSQGRGHD